MNADQSHTFKHIAILGVLNYSMRILVASLITLKNNASQTKHSFKIILQCSAQNSKYRNNSIIKRFISSFIFLKKAERTAYSCGIIPNAYNRGKNTTILHVSLKTIKLRCINVYFM